MIAAPSIRLDGKVALVTGGGAGIGRAIVDAYAALGASVAVIEVDAARAADLRHALGDAHLVVEGDVRSAGGRFDGFRASRGAIRQARYSRQQCRRQFAPARPLCGPQRGRLGRALRGQFENTYLRARRPDCH